MEKKIIGFSGSNSSTSINQQLVQTIAAYFSSATMEILDLRDYDAPVYGKDLEGQFGIPDQVLDLKEKLAQGSGYVLSVPEHNGSIPAFFKNIIDWLSRTEGPPTFNDKPVLLLSASPGGRGGASVLEHLKKILPYQGAQIIATHGVGSFHEKVKDHDIKEETDKTVLKTYANELEKAIHSKE